MHVGQYFLGAESECKFLGEEGGVEGIVNVYVTLRVPVTLTRIFTCIQSADTGGLLDNDWTTPRRHRLKVLQIVQSSPSRLFFDGEKFVYKPGAYANRECDPRWRLWQEQERQRLREGGYDVEWEEGEFMPVVQSMRHSQEQEMREQEAETVREWAV